LPKGGDFPFYPKKTKDGKLLRNRKGGFIDKYGNSWEWDPKKQEWDVQHFGTTNIQNVNMRGMKTHRESNF
jgi:hypothetical protein